jgi:hypothetical protein
MVMPIGDRVFTLRVLRQELASSPGVKATKSHVIEYLAA